jgi:hypothetical protein
MAAPTTPASLPRWLILAGSAVILLHFVAVGINVLTSPSGPWPTPFGGTMAMPPQFAYSASQLSAWDVKVIPAYLQSMKMTHTYHFATSHTGMDGVYFEVRLRDADGKELETLHFPDKDANPWVRHRQQLLAYGLGDDMPYVPPTTDLLAAAGQDAPRVLVWVGEEGAEMRLRKEYIHLLPKERPSFQPSEWSQILARSYARHLCRTRGAATAEVVRYSRPPYPPAILDAQNAPPSSNFRTVVSNFGELSK